jgi:hypothetical protein
MPVYPLLDLWLKSKEGLCVLIITLFIALFTSFSAHAQEIANEDKIKASYVFNFIRFIEWPLSDLKNHSAPGSKNAQPKNSHSQNHSANIVVCVLNRKKQFIKAFNPVIGKKVRGQTLQFKELTNTSDISQCNLLYIDKAEKNMVSELLLAIKKYHILSISDIKSFCRLGGMIGMVTKKGKIKVEINLNVAKTAGFKISSNLLEVATIVGRR